MGFGIPASSTVIFYAPSTLTAYQANDTDVTAYVTTEPTDWHLVMGRIGGTRQTFLVPDYFASTAAEVAADTVLP